MNSSKFKKQDASHICITEFDSNYRQYGSCNTPLAKLPKVYLKKVEGLQYEVLWRLNSHATIQEFELPHDYWAINLPDPDCEDLFCYKSLCEGETSSFTAKPGQTAIWQIPADCSTIIVFLHHSYFESTLAKDEIVWLKENCSHIKRRALNDELLTHLSRFVLHQIEQPDATRSPNTSKKIASNIALELFQVLTQSNINKVRAFNRERVLTRALAYIHYHYAEDLRLNNIASYACSTVRNLQLIFKAQFDLTPLQYIKRYRLAKFHQQLIYSKSVTHSAIHCGLRHMGRASDGYRSLFGENPGDFLSRTRTKAELIDD